MTFHAAVRQKTHALSLVCCVLLSSALSHARAWYEAGPDDRVALKLAPDIALTAAGVAGFTVSELLKKSLAPAHCRICDGADNSGLPDGSNNGRSDLNSVDAFFHDALTCWLLDRKAADTASSVYAFVVLPLGSIAGALTATGPHASANAGWRNAVIVAESSAVSVAVVQAVKFVAARKRPFVRYSHGTWGSVPETGSTYDVKDPDSRLSFPSGHTAFATALGVSMAMTATFENSSAGPWLWGAAGAMSVSTAMLRMIAEKHYFTDVAVGALIGAACGAILPLLHKRGNLLAAETQTTGVPGGGSPLILLSGVF